MRVVIDTSYADRGPSGTATYIRSLVSALRDLSELEVIEASQPRRLRRGRDLGSRGPAGLGRSAVNLGLDAAWRGWGLPRVARRHRADLLHHPLPSRSRTWAGPEVVTVHDLAFERLPGAFDPMWRLPARRAHRRAARSCAAVVCVSEVTAEDVRSYWGVPRERIVVAPHGAPVLDAVPGDGEPHFLYVGDDEPRKDLGTLVAAWVEYRGSSVRSGREPLPLVLAGRMRSRGPAGTAIARGIDLDPQRLRVVERPSHDELTRLYRSARALVHPALHEGFGLTMLEAMAHGTPVVAAASAAAREVCGDAALYFEPSDHLELAAALRRIESDPERAGEMGERGRQRAASFTWAESARRHLEAYILAVEARENG